MTILNDRQIESLCYGLTPMISPFVNAQVKLRGTEITAVSVSPGGISPMGHAEKVISYGLSSYGYDVRCADEFKVFTNINSTVIDPKAFEDKVFVDVVGNVCIIPPNSFALTRTVEYFRVPRNVMIVAVGKSTYARVGVIINVTPIEPGFEGQVVIEISNTTPLPVKVYANEGISQFLFFTGEPCGISYADRGGKYQGQTGITTART